jgi:hypothetical protein
MFWKQRKRGCRPAAILIAICGVLPIGCGSDGGSEAKVISGSEFLAQARPICEKGKAKADKEYSYWAERAHLHADSEDFMNKKVAKFVLPWKKQQLREMQALALPEGREKKLKAFLAAWEEGIEKGKKDPSTLRVGKYAFQRAFEMAESVGLQTCFIG